MDDIEVHDLYVAALMSRKVEQNRMLMSFGFGEILIWK